MWIFFNRILFLSTTVRVVVILICIFFMFINYNLLRSKYGLSVVYSVDGDEEAEDLKEKSLNSLSSSSSHPHLAFESSSSSSTAAQNPPPFKKNSILIHVPIQLKPYQNTFNHPWHLLYRTRRCSLACSVLSVDRKFGRPFVQENFEHRWLDESDDDAASSWEEFWLPRVDAVVEDWPVNGTGIMEDTERVEKGENNGPLKVFIEPRPADYKFQHNNEDYDVVLLSNQPGNKMAKDGSSLYDLSAHLLENNNKGNTNKAHSLSSSSSSQKPAIIASYSSLKSHVNHNKMIPFNLIANAYRDPTDFISRIHDTYTIPSAHAPHYSKKTAGIMIAFLPDCSKLPPAHIAYIKALKQVLDEIAGKGGGVGGGGGIGLFIHSGCLSKGNQPATPSMPDDKRIKLVAGYKFVLVWDARMGDVGRGYVSEAYFRALAYDAVVVVLGSDEDIVRPVMISTEQTIRVTTTTTNGGGHDNDNDDVVLVIDPTGVYNRKPEALGRKIWSIASSQDAWEGMMQWKRIQSTRKSSSSSSSHMSQGGEAVAADINPSPQFRRLWKQSIESLVCRICDQVLLHSGAYGDGDHLEEDRKEFYPFDMDEYLESNE